MDKVAISRLSTIPQQLKPLKQDPGAKVHGSADDGARTGAKPASTAIKAAAAQKAPGKDPGLLKRIQEIQALADRAFADEDLRLSISFDERIGRFIYRGLDPETGEVKREFPPEEVIKTITALREIAGIAVDRKL